ncbi:squalene/phytoene synthase family protein [Aquisalimonas asiatica]|uniref:Phytoene synthase n=1 Tax=Aquisalimonas asiatica TaxID=406100 RepID=A0A1H8RUG5_9GAMM|nr:squalene/phytoene synthase family protein [Aquisalimonas asiatica]SEO70002.1 phytoene synthase [Aquisalimonas asiatica]
MEPLSYCHRKVAPPGSAIYYALRFSPDDQRDALVAVHAFHAEVTEIPDEVSDPGVGEVKLQWWRDEVQRLFDGTPRHPVSQALAPAVARHDLPADAFTEMLDGTGMDLAYGGYPGFRELTVYCHRTGGSLARLLTAVAGTGSAASAHFAHDLGMALTLRRRLLSVRRDAQSGRVYIPEDELEQAGVSREDLLGHETPPAARTLFREQADRVHAFLDQAESHLPDAERAVHRSGIILAALDRALLREMAKDNFPLLEQGFELTPLRRLWIAWRTARQQQRLSRKAA